MTRCATRDANGGPSKLLVDNMLNIFYIKRNLGSKICGANRARCGQPVPVPCLMSSRNHPLLSDYSCVLKAAGPGCEGNLEGERRNILSTSLLVPSLLCALLSLMKFHMRILSYKVAFEC